MTSLPPFGHALPATGHQASPRKPDKLQATPFLALFAAGLFAEAQPVTPLPPAPARAASARALPGQVAHAGIRHQAATHVLATPLATTAPSTAETARQIGAQPAAAALSPHARPVPPPAPPRRAAGVADYVARTLAAPPSVLMPRVAQSAPQVEAHYVGRGPEAKADSPRPRVTWQPASAKRAAAAAGTEGSPTALSAPASSGAITAAGSAPAAPSRYAPSRPTHLLALPSQAADGGPPTAMVQAPAPSALPDAQALADELARVWLQPTSLAPPGGAGMQRLSVALDAGQLGAMRLVIEHDAGHLTVRLEQANAQAIAWLHGHHHELADAIKRVGFADVQWQFPDDRPAHDRERRRQQGLSEAAALPPEPALPPVADHDTPASR